MLQNVCYQKMPGRLELQNSPYTGQYFYSVTLSNWTTPKESYGPSECR